MSLRKQENQIFSGNPQVDNVYHTLEWLISAFAWTLVFIIFVMQVYRIPTGSMAETLRGSHFRVRCAQCGNRYDHDFISRNYPIPGTNRAMPDTMTPSRNLPILPHSPVCPSCGFAEKDPEPLHNGQYVIFEGNQPVPAKERTVFKGDQIFVIKSIYQFFKPNRWDVIVFKNPLEPRINYIKRCIGLQGETVQLVEGDVYIDGQIARKPDKVQEELWMLLFDNDYQPARPQEPDFYQPLSETGGRVTRIYDRQPWQQPFELVEGSTWKLDGENGTVFELDSDSQDIQRVRYNDRMGTGFRVTYAYDDPAGYRFMPIAGDLMVQYHMTMEPESSAGAEIRNRGIVYQGLVHGNGTLQICKLTNGLPEVLAAGNANVGDFNKLTRFRFAFVDRLLVLEYGSSKLTVDLGGTLESFAQDEPSAPQVQIAGSGKLQLRHIALYRDIHYTPVDSGGRPIVHGSQDNPMKLEKGEYFACGDNSPASYDSRFWDRPGLANSGVEPYRPGVVPHEYLVGKAFFVHWPGGYRPEYESLEKIPALKFLYGIRWIPYIDGMKPIYGGKR